MPPIKGKMLTYPEENMLQAIDDVRIRGMPVATAAKKFDVPRVTLMYKCSGKTPVQRKMGPATVLSFDEEKVLETWIISSARSNFPVNKNQLLDSVQMFVKEMKRETPFKDERPGRAWFEAFLKRHPIISERVAQNLTASRASVTKNAIHYWFDEVSDYLTSHDYIHILENASRVFNLDESAFFLNPKGNKVLARKGDKSVYQQVNTDEKECLTVLANANAEGLFAPTMIVFKYKKIPSEVATSVPKDWAIGKSDSGWMNGELFYEYITNIFYKWLLEHNIQLPIILFIDGHTSHLTMHTSKFCHDKQIILISLYPNSTHLLQPLDIGFFSPMKTQWKQEVYKWRIANLPTPKLKKANFAPLLFNTINALDHKIMKNAFRKAGLVPWDKNAVDYSKTLTVLANNDSTISKPVETSCQLISEEAGLCFLEKEIGVNKLCTFKQSCDDWNGDICDKSLFLLWKSLSRRVHLNYENNILPIDQESNDQRNIPIPNSLPNNDLNDRSLTLVSNTQELPSNFVTESSNRSHNPSSNAMVQVATIASLETIFSQSHDVLTNQEFDAVLNNQQQRVESIVLPIDESCNTTASAHSTPAKNVSGGQIIPSPFKRVLFWPEPKPSSSKRRAKEKVPAVVSSVQYLQYLQKKKKEKEEREQKRIDNLRKRKEKRDKIQKKKTTKPQATKKRKRMRQESSSSENESNWEESGSSTLDASFEAPNEEFKATDGNGESLEDLHDPLELNPQEEKENASDYENEGANNEMSLEINDFAVIRFSAKKKCKYFVAKIVDRIGDEGIGFEVAFLKYDEQGKFKWPIVEDKSYINVKDIVVKLPECQIDRRERLFFDYDFTKFKNLG